VATPIDEDPEIEALYRLPLADFVAARDALAARRRSAGDKDAAARVKRLAKPSPAAWAVNQLHWSDPRALEPLFEATRQLRETQARGEPAALVRAATQRRREALTGLVKAAQERLEGAGHGVAPLVLRRVSATLEALAHRASGGEAVMLGRLAEDLEPPGVEALEAVAAAPALIERPAGSAVEAPSAPARVLVPLQAAAAAAAHRASEAERQAALARERLAAANDELLEARRRLQRAEDRARDAEIASVEAAARAEAAAAEKQAADGALEAARAESGD
jgi:hypothetical protein